MVRHSLTALALRQSLKRNDKIQDRTLSTTGGAAFKFARWGARSDRELSKFHLVHLSLSARFELGRHLSDQRRRTGARTVSGKAGAGAHSVWPGRLRYERDEMRNGDRARRTRICRPY